MPIGELQVLVRGFHARMNDVNCGASVTALPYDEHEVNEKG